eukprot:TRINITY_DN50076_c0_g1_i1.p1 TRINITY_DN50076_c0_g1~~TRINITY_DN50076_c0_g1_i1.p1  ORF type:complete len:792 (+),score=212.62 TRINITY_DN50076_c0_g1_i1:107-2482(+)
MAPEASGAWKLWAAAGAGLTASCLLLRGCLKRRGVVREAPQGPLAGVRILECAVNIAGPWSATLLAELGAEVIKVEALDLADSVRGLGTSPALGMAGMFCVMGRGKRSIVLNLKDPEGKKVFFQLVQWADVFLQNYRPGAAARMGISYEEMKKVNKDIIYLSSSGFGQEGPYSHCRIYDPVIQCASGFTYQQADRESGSPHILAQVFFDKTNAMFGAQGLIAALLARDRGAGGQHLEIAMLNSALMWMWPDGYSQHAWRDGGSGPRPPGGHAVIDKLIQEQGDGDFQNAEEANKDPTLAKYFGGGRHLLFGEFRLPNFPASFSATPLRGIPCAPMLGENTNRVLRELGYSAAECEELVGLGKSRAGQAPATSTRSLLARRGDMKKAKVFGLVEKLQGGYGLHCSRAKPCQQFCGTAAGAKADPALKGIKVIDAGGFVAGPFCCSILADQGASVVKVEMDCPDPSLRFGAHPKTGERLGATYMALNRNKKSIKLCNTGASELEQLVKKADVIVADEDTDRRLSYDICKAWNPAVVYVQIDKNGGEIACQRRSGQKASQLNDAGKPTFTEAAICEKSTGLYASISACAALFARNRGSGGQFVHIEMMGATLHFSAVDLWMNLCWKNPKERRSFPSIGGLYNTFFKEAKDKRKIFSCPLSDKEWKQFVDVFMPSKTHLYEGEFATIPGRLGHIDVLRREYLTVLEEHTSGEFLRKGTQAELACSVAKTLDEVLECPQAKHNETFVELPSSAAGGARFLHARTPVVFERTPTKVQTPAPSPGEHSVHDVLMYYLA